MKDLLNLLLNGDYTVFILLSAMFIFIWLFKDMKKSLLDTKKSDLDFLDRSIDAHAKTLNSIILLTRNNLNKADLLTTLYSSYKYFDQSLIHKIDLLSSFTLSSEKQSYLLIELCEEIRSKLKSLKNMQIHPIISKNYSFRTLDFFDMMNRNNFDVYFNTFLYTLIIFTIFFSALDVSLEYYKFNKISYISFILFIVTLVFHLFSTSISIELLVKKHYKNPALFILFFVLPFLFIYLIQLSSNSIVKLIYVIIFSISVIINFFIIVKYSKDINKK